MTGTKLLQQYDSGLCVKFFRDKTERDRCSDRMKRIRKAGTKKMRIKLKQELRNESLV